LIEQNKQSEKVMNIGRQNALKQLSEKCKNDQQKLKTKMHNSTYGMQETPATCARSLAYVHNSQLKSTTWQRLCLL